MADKNLRPLTVSLVCGELDGRSAIRLLQCQRLFQGCLNAECQYSFVDLAEGLSQVASVAPADCTVLLYQGITILPADGDWEPELLAAGYAGACDWEPAEITVVPADVRHPLLSGVGPFSSRSGMPAEACVTSDGVGLLLGEKGGVSRPVAWARESAGDRVFHTSLGGTDDFCEPDFCHILSRAVAWVAGA